MDVCQRRDVLVLPARVKKRGRRGGSRMNEAGTTNTALISFGVYLLGVFSCLALESCAEKRNSSANIFSVVATLASGRLH